VTLRLSQLARADLRGIARKIKMDNGAAVADRITGRIVSAMKQLERFPESGRPGREAGTRELGVAGLPFIIVYRLQPALIAVDRVIHGARQWPPDVE
jgi:plasmid stabilization system protein ParE